MPKKTSLNLTKKFKSPGVLVLIALAALGGIYLVYSSFAADPDRQLADIANDYYKTVRISTDHMEGECGSTYTGDCYGRAFIEGGYWPSYKLSIPIHWYSTVPGADCYAEISNPYVAGFRFRRNLGGSGTINEDVYLTYPDWAARKTKYFIYRFTCEANGVVTGHSAFPVHVSRR